MKLLAIKVECSHESKDGLNFFVQDELGARGIESRKWSDFIAEDQKHDSSLVELGDIENLPKSLELTAYFDYESADKKDLIEKIMGKITGMKNYGLDTGRVSISTKEVADEDWNTAWWKHYHVIDFSHHLAIVPEWEDYHPAFSDQKLIRLDLGLAFGTSGHATTQLVLLVMEQALVKPMLALDVGTGSDILAIAASKLEANRVLGIDISDKVVTAAKENIALNNTDNIDVRKASLLKDIDEKYDLIIANILADILLELIPDLGSHLDESGRVIFSGIDHLQLPKVEEALAKNNFEIKMKMQERRWIGLLIARKPD